MSHPDTYLDLNTSDVPLEILDKQRKATEDIPIEPIQHVILHLPPILPHDLNLLLADNEALIEAIKYCHSISHLHEAQNYINKLNSNIAVLIYHYEVYKRTFPDDESVDSDTAPANQDPSTPVDAPEPEPLVSVPVATHDHESELSDHQRPYNTSRLHPFDPYDNIPAPYHSPPHTSTSIHHHNQQQLHTPLRISSENSNPAIVNPSPPMGPDDSSISLRLPAAYYLARQIQKAEACVAEMSLYDVDVRNIPTFPSSNKNANK